MDIISFVSFSNISATQQLRRIQKEPNTSKILTFVKGSFSVATEMAILYTTSAVLHLLLSSEPLLSVRLAGQFRINLLF